MSDDPQADAAREAGASTDAALEARPDSALGSQVPAGSRTAAASETSETSTGSAPTAGSRLLHALWAGVREVVIVVGLAMIVSLIVKTFLLQPFHIPSGSMEDTLLNGDRVVVSKLTPGVVGLQRGDIVVFTDPDHWLGEPAPVDHSALHATLIFLGLAPDDSHEHLIKRVIGLPGDHVVCCDVDGRLTVNGVPISETYLKPGDTPAGGRAPFSIIVPAGKVWVMGDHRSDSGDSRLHDDGTGATGSVPIEDIKGRAILVVWPLNRFTWLSVPSSIYSGIPTPSG